MKALPWPALLVVFLIKEDHEYGVVALDPGTRTDSKEALKWAPPIEGTTSLAIVQRAGEGEGSTTYRMKDLTQEFGAQLQVAPTAAEVEEIPKWEKNLVQEHDVDVSILKGFSETYQKAAKKGEYYRFAMKQAYSNPKQFPKLPDQAELLTEDNGYEWAGDVGVALKDDFWTLSYTAWPGIKEYDTEGKYDVLRKLWQQIQTGKPKDRRKDFVNDYSSVILENVEGQWYKPYKFLMSRSDQMIVIDRADSRFDSSPSKVFFSNIIYHAWKQYCTVTNENPDGNPNLSNLQYIAFTEVSSPKTIEIILEAYRSVNSKGVDGQVACYKSIGNPEQCQKVVGDMKEKYRTEYPFISMESWQGDDPESKNYNPVGRLAFNALLAAPGIKSITTMLVNRRGDDAPDIGHRKIDTILIAWNEPMKAFNIIVRIPRD